MTTFGAGEPARHTYCPDENHRCQHGDDMNCPALKATAYVCRVVGPAGAVRYLGKDFEEMEFSKDAIHYETPKDAWDALEEFSHRPEALKLYADVINPEDPEDPCHED